MVSYFFPNPINNLITFCTSNDNKNDTQQTCQNETHEFVNIFGDAELNFANDVNGLNITVSMLDSAVNFSNFPDDSHLQDIIGDMTDSEFSVLTPVFNVNYTTLNLSDNSDQSDYEFSHLHQYEPNISYTHEQELSQSSQLSALPMCFFLESNVSSMDDMSITDERDDAYTLEDLDTNDDL